MDDGACRERIPTGGKRRGPDGKGKERHAACFALSPGQRHRKATSRSPLRIAEVTEDPSVRFAEWSADFDVEGDPSIDRRLGARRSPQDVFGGAETCSRIARLPLSLAGRAGIADLAQLRSKPTARYLEADS